MRRYGTRSMVLALLPAAALAAPEPPQGTAPARPPVPPPAATIDPGIQAPAPDPKPGTMPVIPPPGTPGGDPRVQPK